MDIEEFMKRNPGTRLVKNKRKLYWASDAAQWEVFSNDNSEHPRGLKFYYKGLDLEEALRVLRVGTIK